MHPLEHLGLADERFADKLRELHGDGDTENQHAMADGILCELLESLGFSKTVEAYNAVHKWYA